MQHVETGGDGYEPWNRCTTLLQLKLRDLEILTDWHVRIVWLFVCLACRCSRPMAHGGTAVERNCQLMNALLDCNKNADVTTGFVTSYQQVRAHIPSSRLNDLLFSQWYAAAVAEENLDMTVIRHTRIFLCRLHPSAHFGVYVYTSCFLAGFRDVLR